MSHTSNKAAASKAANTTTNTTNGNTAAVLNVLALDAFSFAAGTDNTDYAVDTTTGRVYIKVRAKHSNVGTGKLTTYDTSITWQDGTAVDYNGKVIGFYKGLFGAVVNHRDGTAAASGKVLTDAEVSEKVAAKRDTLAANLDRLNKVMHDMDAAAAPIVVDMDGLTAAYRAALLAANDTAKAAKAAAEKAAAEKAAKAAKRDTAAKVMNLDATQAAALAALIASGVDLAALAAAAKTA